MELTSYNEALTAEQAYIEYAVKTKAITEAQVLIMESLSTDALKAKYIQDTIKDNEKEAFKAEQAEAKKETVKTVNKWLYIVIAYLIAVPFISYYAIGHIELEFLKSLGALGLTIVVTAILTGIAVIRWFIIEFYEIKNVIKKTWDNEILFDITLGNILTVLAVVVTVIKVVF